MASQSRVSDFFPTVRSSSSRKSSSLSVKRLPPILSVKDSDNDTRSPDPHTSDSSITPTKKRHIAKSKTIRKKCPSPKTPLSPSLSAQEIKEKLKNCKNLSKLKEKLSSINGCADKVKQFKEMKVKCFSPVKPSYSNLSPRKILSPEKLSLSGMTVIPSPLKASHSVVTPNPSFSRKLFADDEVKVESKPVQTKPSTDVPDISSVDVPAYKKFSYLVKKNTADYSDEFDLPLPYKYQRLVETFKKIDYFAWVYYKRHETCTFEKIKQSIEQTTNRHFDENCLLRILSVPGPKWFKLSREYVKNKSHLTISPVYSSDNKCINSVTNLTEREKSYVRCLLEITRKEHLKFLSELNLQIPADKPIYRWHPMFKLDSVPDILPKKDILPPEKWSNNPNSILNYCFRKTKEAETKEEKKVDSPVKDNSGDKVKKGLLKGVSVDLLNKVSILNLLIESQSN